MQIRFNIFLLGILPVVNKMDPAELILLYVFIFHFIALDQIIIDVNFFSPCDCESTTSTETYEHATRPYIRKNRKELGTEPLQRRL